VVDLRTGEIRDHRLDDYMTKGLSLDNCFIHRVAVERMCSSTRRGSWRVGC
jgi:hypothetical protein